MNFAEIVKVNVKFTALEGGARRCAPGHLSSPGKRKKSEGKIFRTPTADSLHFYCHPKMVML